MHKGDLANWKTSSVQYLLAAFKLALELNVRVLLGAVVCFLGACGTASDKRFNVASKTIEQAKDLAIDTALREEHILHKDLGFKLSIFTCC